VCFAVQPGSGNGRIEILLTLLLILGHSWAKGVCVVLLGQELLGRRSMGSGRRSSHAAFLLLQCEAPES
jgi:hypothetical protein